MTSRQPAPAAARVYPKASSWIGWIAFGATMMVVLGTVQVLQGLVALLAPDHAPPALARRPVVDVDLAISGGAQLVIGVVVVVAGLCVFGGQRWARAVGALLAVTSLVLNFALLGDTPLWSLTVMSLSMVVLLALTVHGSDVRP